MHPAAPSVLLFGLFCILADVIPAPATIAITGAALAGPTAADLASVAIVVSLLALLALAHDVAAALRRLTRGTAHA